MRTDGQTDMTKLIVAFHNFAKAPKNRRMFRLRGASRRMSAWKFKYLKIKSACSWHM